MLRKLIIGIIVALVGALGLLTPMRASAFTCPTDSMRPSAVVDSLAECNIAPDTNGDVNTSVSNTVKYGLNVATGVATFVSVIVIVIGGVYFVISQGDSGKVARARMAVLGGVIGLGIAMLAFAIVNFVLGNVLK